MIGTVEGDLHDIGKNLVGMLLQGAGFAVVNLGTGVTAQQFVAAVKEHAPAIVGMSALLTTTLPHMAEMIAALKEAGLRDQVKVMVGGAPVTQAFADELGADGYGANAGMAVDGQGPRGAARRQSCRLLTATVASTAGARRRATTGGTRWPRA